MLKIAILLIVTVVLAIVFGFVLGMIYRERVLKKAGKIVDSTEKAVTGAVSDAASAVKQAADKL